ncbi:MAG TPA: ABC transporter ATP-binding protein [Vicinamibacterales bacterium]
MPSTVIRADHLGKQYTLGRRRRNQTAREALTDAVSRLFHPGRAGASERTVETFWALDDVSFEVETGDVVGIIGPNGAGKSTLLKVLSQITEPTKGYVDVTGRIGCLLEVGTGFHEDLTGRENTYLNGAILGMSKAEIDRKFDEIVAFAEIERFIDTPVKHYSSGMYMRLAFAVAAHLETEILVVDEVLAVGDAQFQKKCLGKIDAVAKQGRTVLFISHNMEAVQRLCSRGMLLDRGRLVAAGPVGDVVERYRSEERLFVDIGRFNPRARSGTGWARITNLVLLDETGRPGSGCPADADLTFEMTLETSGSMAPGASLRGLVAELVICSDQFQPLISIMNVDDDGVELPAASRCRVRATLPGPTFIPGRYRLNAFLGVPYLEHVDDIPDALEFEISPPLHPWRPYQLHASRQIVCRKADWSCAVEMPATPAAQTK